MHGGRLGGDQALGSCNQRTLPLKLGSAGTRSSSGRRLASPWSHDFAAPADNMISIAGLQIGISLGSERHVSIPAWES
jgi:hypothetical protein